MIGLVQYYNGLPAGLVWVHVVLAASTWAVLATAAVSAGPLAPKRVPAAARQEPEPEPAAAL